MQNKSQKADIKEVFLDKNGKTDKHAGKIDYVAGWFYKAAQYIQNSTVSVAFVSTSSIAQGEQVPFVWKPLLEQFKLTIDFAWTPFNWSNEASQTAVVVCVIIGFSSIHRQDNNKIIYNSQTSNFSIVKHISPYLNDIQTTFIVNRTNPLCKVPKLITGSKPVDGKFLSLSIKEKNELVKKYPSAKDMIKPYIGTRELLNGHRRYCLWLKETNPSAIHKIPPIMDRLNEVKKFRLSSKKAVTRESANTPSLFQQDRQPKNNYLAIPTVSSANREYVPMGYLTSNVIASNLLLMMPNATLYDFGIMQSTVHMLWLKTVGGRLGDGFRYSAKIVYNNFPWPVLNTKQKQKIAGTAQAILDARVLYPDSSLADLYDPLTMPTELHKAHDANDHAVLRAYGLKPSSSESEIIQKLFKLYEELEDD